MPSGILPSEGIALPLQLILQQDVVGLLPWTLFLWSNDYVPDATTTLADLVESTWLGYGSRQLTRADWTDPVVVDGCATSTWGTTPIMWTALGGPTEQVFGWAMRDDFSGVLRFVQRFDDADIFTVEAGGQYQLLPTYTLTSCACP